MTPRCDRAIAIETLIDYWAGDLDGHEGEPLEEHLFACAYCAAQLESLASLGTAMAAMVREGRVSGIISRTLLNRMQREGLRVRVYVLSPGETVPCAVFPGDDVVVAALRAPLAGAHAVRLSVTGPNDAPMAEIDEVPVSNTADEVLWATPGALVRQIPSARIRLTLTSADASGVRLGEYVLDHTQTS